jgi:wyosine [tRNA(Phe)-imidazoG37] synthetase (radical SAM superfamily)
MNDKNEHPERNVLGDHRRQWRNCLYVYPVISRRAEGLSIGVNLNIDKRCNFACRYCQIDRHLHRQGLRIDTDRLQNELTLALHAATSGELWSEPYFAATPEKFRRINDIAFSGDGEPTCVENFPQAVAAAAIAAKQACNASEVKIVVITNATQLDQPQFQQALPLLDSHNGEIWAKLDAGTNNYFQIVNRPRPRIPLDRIVQNILSVATARPVVIQTLWFNIDGVAPAPQEIEAYIGQLRKILDGGGKIKLVQLHTIARPRKAIRPRWKMTR